MFSFLVPLDNIEVNIADVTPSEGDRATLFCSFNPVMPDEPSISWKRVSMGSEEEEVIARYSSDGSLVVSV